MQLGIEVLARNPILAKSWGRCALLCNQASVTGDFLTSWQLLHEILGKNLKAFFGPQHGFHATVQDNMIETGHAHGGPFGLPVYSLYSEVREPKAEMLENIDTIIIDIQIVGCRVYTFKYTVAGCLRAAKKLGKRVVVLDRPNPLGGATIEGRVLSPDAQSFVGEFPIPLRHGLTVGEAARFFNKGIGADLDIIRLENWEPKSYWHEYRRQWVLTSPNLPTTDSVYVYPATVMLEGANLSEGRGTGLPFQFVGAPYIASGSSFAERVLHYYKSDSFYLRPTEFQPTSQKWAGEVCHGFQIHVLDPKGLATFPLGLAILRAALDLNPNEFKWKQPPYEYDYVNLPINLILGHLESNSVLEHGLSLEGGFWNAGMENYLSEIAAHLLYSRQIR